MKQEYAVFAAPKRIKTSVSFLIQNQAGLRMRIITGKYVLYVMQLLKIKLYIPLAIG